MEIKNMDNAEIIKNAFKTNNIQLTDQQLDKFEKYFELLIEYNNKYNLTAITDIYEVASKHFVDSVLGAQFFKDNCKVLDIGCGAGFPSVPLAIMRPDLNFILIDSVGKKINFINILIEELKIPNIQAFHTRAQEFCTPQNRSKFDYAVSRAVAPSNILLELSIPFVKNDGVMIAYKGISYKEELEASQNALKQLQCYCADTICKDLIIQTPQLDEMQKRYFVLFKKSKPTPTKYPRPKNLIKSNPL